MEFEDPIIELGITAPIECSYLPGRWTSLALGRRVHIKPQTFDELLARGYRRSGEMYYRPHCFSCRECVPIRVPVADFQPSKSQRRVWRKGQPHFEVEMGTPDAKAYHVTMYNRHARKVSPHAEPTGFAAYRNFLIEGDADTRQIEYRYQGQLIAVSFLDLGSTAASSVYCYWDPDFAAQSPGAFTALWELDWCRRHGITHYYLGYWIRECSRMSYKNRYTPHEMMDWTTAEWLRI